MSATLYEKETQFGLLRVEATGPGQWTASRDDEPLVRADRPGIFATLEEALSAADAHERPGLSELRNNRGRFILASHMPVVARTVSSSDKAHCGAWVAGGFGGSVVQQLFGMRPRPVCTGNQPALYLSEGWKVGAFDHRGALPERLDRVCANGVGLRRRCRETAAGESALAPFHMYRAATHHDLVPPRKNPPPGCPTAPAYRIFECSTCKYLTWIAPPPKSDGASSRKAEKNASGRANAGA
jgi:hypothetical protein